MHSNLTINIKCNFTTQHSADTWMGQTAVVKHALAAVGDDSGGGAVGGGGGDNDDGGGGAEDGVSTEFSIGLRLLRNRFYVASTATTLDCFQGSGDSAGVTQCRQPLTLVSASAASSSSSSPSASSSSVSPLSWYYARVVASGDGRGHVAPDAAGGDVTVGVAYKNHVSKRFFFLSALFLFCFVYSCAATAEVMCRRTPLVPLRKAFLAFRLLCFCRLLLR
jgi:hypothetical protein